MRSKGKNKKVEVVNGSNRTRGRGSGPGRLSTCTVHRFQP